MKNFERTTALYVSIPGIVGTIVFAVSLLEFVSPQLTLPGFFEPVVGAMLCVGSITAPVSLFLLSKEREGLLVHLCFGINLIWLIFCVLFWGLVLLLLILGFKGPLNF
jgi:hypothetical protein